MHRRCIFSLTCNARREPRQLLRVNKKLFKKSFFKLLTFSLTLLYFYPWKRRSCFKVTKHLKWSPYWKTWGANCLAVVVRYPQTINCAFHAAQMQIISVMKFRGKSTASLACVKPAKILFLGVDISV